LPPAAVPFVFRSLVSKIMNDTLTKLVRPGANPTKEVLAYSVFNSFTVSYVQIALLLDLN